MGLEGALQSFIPDLAFVFKSASKEGCLCYTTFLSACTASTGPSATSEMLSLFFLKVKIIMIK